MRPFHPSVKVPVASASSAAILGSHIVFAATVLHQRRSYTYMRTDELSCAVRLRELVDHSRSEELKRQVQRMQTMSHKARKP